MLIAVILLTNALFAVEGWPCESTVEKVFSRNNTDAVLQFDLSGYVNQQTTSILQVKYHNGTTLALAVYNTGDITYHKLPGVDIVADLLGNVWLTKENVETADAGIYYLTLSSTPTRCSCLYILGIPKKPSVSVNNNPPVGGSAILSCRSSSLTTPSNHSLGLLYSWRIDNINNPSGPRYTYSTYKNTLTLSNIVKEDANKQFTCTATEDVTGGYTSSPSDLVSLNVLYGPENVDFSPKATNYEKAENTNFEPVTCIASCNPACSFQWKKVGNNTVVSNSAVLDLSMLSPSETGTYRCTATRSGGSRASKDLTINVVYGPQGIFVSPSSTTYRYNENVNHSPITCGSKCWLCQYRWTGPNSYTFSGAVLDLGTLTRTMHGQYSCSATNAKYSPQRQQQKVVTIEVRYGPDVAHINVKSPYYVTEGEVSELRCSSDCYPGCSYSWINVTSGSEISADVVLSLGTVTRYMAGIYKCTVSNTAVSEYRKSSENSTTVIVRYAPDVTIAISPPNTTEGANVTLFCIGHGVPSEYHYTGLTQTVNGIVIPNMNRELTGTQQYSSIHFPSLRLEDTGLYTCKLNNNVTSRTGVLDQTGSVNVTVKVMPKVLTDKFRFTATIGGNVLIQVPVYSFTKLDTVSVKQYNGVDVVQDDRYNISTYSAAVEAKFYDTYVTLHGEVFTMTIRNLVEDDFKNYSVTFTNGLGATDFRFSIIAEGIPSPPKSFQLLPGQKSPTFIWEKNYDGGTAQHFIIQISHSGTEQWVNHTNKTDLQYKINDIFYMSDIQLQPGVFEARIFAKNAIGESEVVYLGHTFEVYGEEDRSTSSGKRSDSNAAIGSSLGLVCVILAIYACIVTILWRRNVAVNDVKKPDKPDHQMTYVNLTFKPGTQALPQDNNEESQYTSLERQSRDDRNTYDVLR